MLQVISRVILPVKEKKSEHSFKTEDASLQLFYYLIVLLGGK